jgi:hypothetical protein
MIRVSDSHSKRCLHRLGGLAWLVLLASVPGCGEKPPSATVEGTLRQGGRPLDNCLVTFLPEDTQDRNACHSVGHTDAEGRYELRLADQKPGASPGGHRIVVYDLSASTGVRRIDHGTEEMETVGPPPKARAPRFGPQFSSEQQTPLRKEVTPGRQVIDIDIP